MTARWDEIERSLAGSVEIVPRGEAALSQFDFSVGGFWRSFAAVFMVLPIAAFFYLSDYKLWAEERSDLPLPNFSLFMTFEIVGYFLRWALFAAAMAALCRQFGLSHRYVPLMVVFNWSSVIVAALLIPPTALYYFGVIGAEIARVANFSVFFVTILYRLRVAEVTLQIPATSAIAVPLFYVALNIAVKALTSGLHVAVAGG